MSKSVLILGGSGLLGQTLVDTLSAKKYNIICASRTPSINDKHIQVESVDILDGQKVDEIIKAQDIVINCTGQVTNPIYSCYQQNTSGIRNIIQSIKKYNIRLIHISSVSVYGSVEFADESNDLNPETTYGSMKCFADFQIEKSLENYVILRVSNLYGKYQQKGIINYLTKSFKEKSKKLYFNNNGELRRYYLYAKDLAEAISSIIEQESIKGIYNIIGNKQYTIKELIAIFENELNYKYDVDYTTDQPYDNVSFISDEKVKSLISLEYTKLEDYIRSLV